MELLLQSGAKIVAWIYVYGYLQYHTYLDSVVLVYLRLVLNPVISGIEAWTVELRSLVPEGVGNEC